MVLDLPTSTQWITFPTNPLDYYTVSWKDGKSRKANYYTCKCYWGNLLEQAPAEAVIPQQAGQRKQVSKPRALPDAKIDVLGETRLFLAAELVESQFIGGPYEGFHIKGLAGATGTTKSYKSWLTMQLNECFHYGQQGKDKKIERWIVYHPPISTSLTAPRIFAHRFFDLDSQDPVKAVLEDGQLAGSRSSSSGVKLAAKLGFQSLAIAHSSAKAAFGHYLHTFLDAQLLERADLLVRANNSKLAASLDPTKRRLLAIQFVESELAEHENRNADQNISIRVREEMKEAAQVEGVQAKPESWWSSVFSTDTAAAQQKLREVANLQEADCDASVYESLKSSVNIPQPESRPRLNAAYNNARR